LWNIKIVPINQNDCIILKKKQSTKVIKEGGAMNKENKRKTKKNKEIGMRKEIQPE